MANERKVIVKGGGQNLYSISESSGKFRAYKNGFPSRSQIGTASSLEDALALIKGHSGRDIQEIK
jgi:hypothetical protein